MRLRLSLYLDVLVVDATQSGAIVRLVVNQGLAAQRDIVAGAKYSQADFLATLDHPSQTVCTSASVGVAGRQRGKMPLIQAEKKEKGKK